MTSCRKSCSSYSPEHQRKPGHLDEPQRQIPSEDPVKDKYWWVLWCCVNTCQDGFFARSVRAGCDCGIWSEDCMGKFEIQSKSKQHEATVRSSFQRSSFFSWVLEPFAKGFSVSEQFPRDDLYSSYSPEHQRRPRHLDEPQRQISSEDLVT